jgi:hypothetical protein
MSNDFMEVTGRRSEAMIEHRYARRIPMQVNVVVHVAGTTLVNGITRNISSDGVCLKLKEVKEVKKESAHKVKRNQQVRVAFNTGKRLIIMPALVVRNNDNAVALVFAEETAPKKQILKDFLYAGAEQVEEPMRMRRHA